MLVVDDDLDTLRTLDEVLVFEGFPDVHCVRSLAEADQLLATGFVPSAVVLDLALAGERGEVLVAKLGSDALLARVPVIAVSGDHRALANVQASVARTLLKPASPAELVQVLREVCRDRDAAAERPR